MNEPTFQKTVLVIDDLPESMDILVQMLIQANFRVLIAESGQEALQVLQQAIHQQSLPDIILLDVSLPGIDGFETCRQIKSMPEVQDLPVLFITAHNESVDMVRGFDVGGADYITKPVNLAEVQARINTHMMMHRMRNQLLVQNNSLTQSLQEQVVQLDVEVESRKQTIQELDRLLEERDSLLDVVRSQSEQLSEVTANALASQNEQQQSMLRLLGQQMQEKLSNLRTHLDAAYTQIDNSVNQDDAMHRHVHTSADTNQSALEHLNASIAIIEKAAEQAGQILNDLEGQADLAEQNDGLTTLSTREREVLNLIAQGKDNSDIAAILHVEPTTVRTHRARIMSKLDAQNSYELMRIALLYVHNSNEPKA